MSGEILLIWENYINKVKLEKGRNHPGGNRNIQKCISEKDAKNESVPWPGGFLSIVKLLSALSRGCQGCRQQQDGARFLFRTQLSLKLAAHTRMSSAVAALPQRVCAGMGKGRPAPSLRTLRASCPPGLTQDLAPIRLSHHLF